MAIIVRCACGEGFDVPDSAAGKLYPCPHCGQKLDIPSAPPVALNSQKYVGPGGAWNPDDGVPTGDAFAKLPLCPRCQGSGTCPTCGGKGADYHGAALGGGVRSFFAYLFLGLRGGVWGWRRFVALDNATISTARCANCNDNGKCYHCRGYGRLLGA